jgi:rod shape-determining protein MreC
MNFFKDKKKYRFFLAVAVLLIFLNIIGFSSLGQRALFKIMYPGSFFIKNFTSFSSLDTKSKTELIENISSLEKDIESSQAELARLYSLEEENEKLRQYLKFFEENSYEYVLAKVLWQENLLNLSSYNQNIIINKGEKDGLRFGLAVVNESGVIIGKIIEVNETNSRVCLINNNFCKMAVSINNSNSSIGLAEGDLGLSVKLNFVSQNEIVNVGDMIITSGLEKDIPRGLAVARINNIEQEVTDIWQNVNAEALFNINNLNIVSVIIPK